MAPTKMHPCVVCGTPTRNKRKRDLAWQCYECGQRAWRECAAQMHAKSGPYYDRWLAHGMDAAEQLRARSGPIYGYWRKGVAFRQVLDADRAARTAPPSATMDAADG